VTRKALESADDKANSTVFIEFMLDIILAIINASDPVEKLLSVMDEGYFSSAQIMAKVGLSHKLTFRTRVNQNEPPRYIQ